MTTRTTTTKTTTAKTTAAKKSTTSTAGNTDDLKYKSVLGMDVPEHEHPRPFLPRYGTVDYSFSGIKETKTYLFLAVLPNGNVLAFDNNGNSQAIEENRITW